MAIRRRHTSHLQLAGHQTHEAILTVGAFPGVRTGGFPRLGPLRCLDGRVVRGAAILGDTRNVPGRVGPGFKSTRPPRALWGGCNGHACDGRRRRNDWAASGWNGAARRLRQVRRHLHAPWIEDRRTIRSGKRDGTGVPVRLALGAKLLALLFFPFVRQESRHFAAVLHQVGAISAVEVVSRLGIVANAREPGLRTGGGIEQDAAAVRSDLEPLCPDARDEVGNGIAHCDASPGNGGAGNRNDVSMPEITAGLRSLPYMRCASRLAAPGSDK